MHLLTSPFLSEGIDFMNKNLQRYVASLRQSRTLGSLIFDASFFGENKLLIHKFLEASSQRVPSWGICGSTYGVTGVQHVDNQILVDFCGAGDPLFKDTLVSLFTKPLFETQEEQEKLVDHLYKSGSFVQLAYYDWSPWYQQLVEQNATCWIAASDRTNAKTIEFKVTDSHNLYLSRTRLLQIGFSAGKDWTMEELLTAPSKLAKLKAIANIRYPLSNFTEALKKLLINTYDKNYEFSSTALAIMVIKNRPFLVNESAKQNFKMNTTSTKRKVVQEVLF